MKPAKGLLSFVLMAAATGGCSDASQGPFSLGGYGNTLEPHRDPHCFVVDACSEDGAKTVTITHVEANRVTGTREPILFRVAWPEGPHFQRVVSARQPGLRASGRSTR